VIEVTLVGQGLGAVLGLHVSNAVIPVQDHDQVPPEVPAGAEGTAMVGVAGAEPVLLVKEADPRCLTGEGILEIGTLRKCLLA
jgi:hypothetical protein